MVVGGGISGIQAALDLATSGYKVYLVEKDPTIGGKMAQLDKTFPTNDCSMCIESPKFIECDRHPNIEILTYTEVDTVEGEAGDFEVTLTRKPRYVKEEICTGCTTCVEYCPIHDPRSVQPGAVGQQGDPHLLLPGRSAGPLHRRQVPLPAGREVLHLRGRLQEQGDRSAPEGGEAGHQGRGDRPLSRLRGVRSQGAGRLRLRDDRERGDQSRLRAAAVRHRAARGRDPAPLRPQAPAQDRLDPLRRLPAGARGRPQLLLVGLLLLRAEAGDPDQGPRRRYRGGHLPQRHPLLRQGFRAVLPRGRRSSPGSSSSAATWRSDGRSRKRRT